MSQTICCGIFCLSYHCNGMYVHKQSAVTFFAYHTIAMVCMSQTICCGIFCLSYHCNGMYVINNLLRAFFAYHTIAMVCMSQTICCGIFCLSYHCNGMYVINNLLRYFLPIIPLHWYLCHKQSAEAFFAYHTTAMACMSQTIC